MNIIGRLIDFQKAIVHQVRDKYRTHVVYRNTLAMYRTVGLCYLKSYANLYWIKLDNSLKKDKMLHDIIYLHELGHIYCEHLLVNDTIEYDRIKQLYFDKFNSEPTDVYLHNVLNIAYDIEVNDKLLTLGNIKYLREHKLKPQLARYYGAPSGNRFDTYYQYIIDQCDKDQNLHTDMLVNVMAKELRKNNILIDDRDSQEVLAVANQLDNSGGATDDQDQDESGSKSNQGSRPGQGAACSWIQMNKSIKELKEQLLKWKIKDYEVNHDYKSFPDAIRLHNRGIRGSSGILYSSMRRKRLSHISEKPCKLNILVDVSGSMNRELVRRVVATINDSCNLTSENRLITWNTRLVNDIDLSNFNGKFGVGGGTDIMAGIEWCIKQGMEELIVISDMETHMGELPELNKYIKLKFIVYNSSNFETNVEYKYLRDNCEYIVM